MRTLCSIQARLEIILRELTEKQKQVLEFILDFICRYGHPPTIREICQKFGIASPMGVQGHLKALEKKGYIERNAGKARGIKLTERFGEANGIPLIGQIVEGRQITSIENIKSYHSLNSIFVDSNGLFLLRVKGDYMIGAGINDGDLVIARQQTKVENGEIGAAIVNGEARVRRIYLKENVIKLNTENTEFSAFKYDPEIHDVWIAGKVLGTIRFIRM